MAPMEGTTAEPTQAKAPIEKKAPSESSLLKKIENLVDKLPTQAAKHRVLAYLEAKVNEVPPA